MFRLDGLVINAIGEAVPAAQVFVCTQPNSVSPTNPAIPPSPLATLFADAAGTIPLANPVIVDGNGNYFFYTNVGAYTLVYFDPFNRIPTQVFPDQLVASAGGGSVNSVGLTAPDGFAVSGSPVSSSGNLGLAYSTDWAPGVVVIGPISGSPGSPTRRRLNAADIAGLAGGVSSVNASVTPGSLFAALFTGGPITSSGVLALSFDFQPQLANLFLAGPSSGGLGAVTARGIVPPDLPRGAVVAFTSTPAFNGAANQAFLMTLTGNVASSTFVGGVAGVIYTFYIKQDGAGGHTFAWPANVVNGGPVDPTVNAVNVQSFMFDGTNLYPTGQMQTFI